MRLPNGERARMAKRIHFGPVISIPPVRRVAVYRQGEYVGDLTFAYGVWCGDENLDGYFSRTLSAVTLRDAKRRVLTQEYLNCREEQ